MSDRENWHVDKSTVLPVSVGFILLILGATWVVASGWIRNENETRLLGTRLARVEARQNTYIQRRDDQHRELLEAIESHGDRSNALMRDNDELLEAVRLFIATEHGTAIR